MTNIKITLLVIICGLTIFATTTSLKADLLQQVEFCSKQLDDSKRLVCFDALTKKNQSSQVTIQEKSELYKQQQDAPIIAVSPVAKEIDTQSQENFGKATAPKLTSQEAHLVGDFKGWDENSVFKLDNGQVWRAVRSNARSKRIPKRLSNPKVTISRGAIGSYNLRIEGVSGKLKVKRVK